MRRLVVSAVAVAVVGLAAGARAEDKASPSGTWKWTVQTQGGQREMTLKLKLDGDKLTGTLVSGKNETPIEDGKYQDGEVSFKVTRERMGQKFTFKYHGKVSDNAIKGKVEFERNGEIMSRDWEAKRATD
jgi:hypothetical protein